MPWYGWLTLGFWLGGMLGVLISGLLRAASESTWFEEREQAIAGTDLLP